jgi:hypothetical protein
VPASTRSRGHCSTRALVVGEVAAEEVGKQEADRRDPPQACFGRGGSEPAAFKRSSRLFQLNATDRAQRALLNLLNLASCAMVSMPHQSAER